MAWNQTDTDYPADKTIVDLFQAQVEKRPNDLAVYFNDQQLSYQQLNSKANQLAHYLMSLGVQAETLVGICVERSLEMVIGLLGILKAGGAYVPFDPDYPAERLQFMLEDSQVAVLLSQTHLNEKLPVSQTKLLSLDKEKEQLATYPTENPITQNGPTSLAYVIYTSGSTGKPKGVCIPQQAVVRLVSNTNYAHLNAEQTFLQYAPISFDAATLELWGPLLNGAKLVLMPPNKRDLLDLSHIINQQKVTILWLTSSLFNLMIDEYPQGLLGLKQLLVGGEELSVAHIRRALEILSHTRLINGYGPTENTTFTCCHPIIKSDCLGSIPIGKPIANTSVYILDQEMKPVPIGIVGELCTGGKGLARSYLNRPELTKEKFIKVERFGKTERIYKTGDLARWCPDGNIEYLGRIDHQVKLRGFRIELGEIEAILSQHEAVKEAAVILYNKEDNPRLAAYITLATPTDEISEVLHTWLKNRLPDYMLPASFTVLEKMPLSPNGKLDRKALPAPELPIEVEQILPQTKTEHILCHLWSQVLDIQVNSINLNFFDLGGHSLNATQMMFKIRETLSVEISLHQLFESPTIATMAKVIDRVQMGTHPSESLLDLEVEATLEPTIKPSTSFEPPIKLQSVFLTGATGFLGIYLLYELLTQTTADIYCLVRAANVEAAQKKLQKKLEAYSIWNETFSHRIKPINGDLSKPLLGIPETEFKQLANEIQVIYHNGALVNHIYPYSVLKASNVLGTLEVLRLATQSQTKPVHFISTTGVAVSKSYQKEDILRESDFPEGSELVGGGYVQSKWVAEKLVRRASERGLPVCIYRPTRIFGHSQTGFFNTQDFLILLLKGCIQLGKIPPLEGSEENIMPVDYVSRAIVHLSQQTELLGKTFHLVNPGNNPLKELFNWVNSLGYSLEQVSYTQWRTELSEQTENALYPYLSAFPEEGDSEQHASPQFDDLNTREGLVGTDIACPSVDINLFKIIFSHFK